jgi:hypothetical protein
LERRNRRKNQAALHIWLMTEVLFLVSHFLEERPLAPLTFVTLLRMLKCRQSMAGVQLGLRGVHLWQE